MKQFFKIVLTILILTSLSIPVARAIMGYQTQWQVFADTWLFIIYAFVLYLIGISAIQMIWDERRK